MRLGNQVLQLCGRLQVPAVIIRATGRLLFYDYLIYKI